MPVTDQRKTPGQPQTSRKSKKSFKAKHFLSDKDRAMIRILNKYRLSRTKIAARIGCSISFVSNCINSSTEALGDSRDWDEVDEEFKKQFPLLTCNTTWAGRSESAKTRESPSPYMSHTLVLVFSIHPSGYTAPEATFIAYAAAQSPSPSERIAEIEQEPMSPPMSSLARYPVILFISYIRYIIIMVQVRQDTEAPIQEDEKPVIVEDLRLLPDLVTFLGSLEHDHGTLLGPLQVQDLGTSEKLFAFAHWPEEGLHALLQASLPEITVPQRFMLVHGLKAYA
ncbi:hypothetical protein DXG01_005172 [Tephrocybe rancida]|nr:hypothetical protein DXG01_005172 [Tephrocybe rancida]